MSMKDRILLTALALVLVSNGVSAKVRMPSIFTDHMVMQQNADNKIWGTAAPGKKVTVKTSGTRLRSALQLVRTEVGKRS